MNDPQLRRQLRSVLVELYADLGEIKLLARDIGIDTNRIVWGGSALLNWQALLDEVGKQDKLPTLLARVQGDYGDNPQLAPFLPTDQPPEANALPDETAVTKRVVTPPTGEVGAPDTSPPQPPSTPLIDSRLDSPLSPAAEAVLKALFAGYQLVIVRGEFTDGRSGSRVLQVRPVHQAGPELGAIVKIDTIAAIKQEWGAYQSCIQNKLPNIAALQGEPVFLPDNPLAGLRYQMAGDSVFAVTSLARYLHQAELATLASALQRILRALTALWEQKSVQPDLFLLTTYDSYLPANLIVEQAELPAPAELMALSPQSARFTPWQLATPVRIAGFQVREIDADKGRLLLDAPQASQAFRFYVQVESVDGYKVGQPLARPIIGIIRERRHDLLAQRAAFLVPAGAQLTDPSFTLATGQQLPNPLAHYESVLKWSFDANVACTHGDLHAQNVLVEEANGLMHLIDFGQSGPNHALRDLVNLEMSLTNSFLPAFMGNASPEALFDFYERLHTAVVRGQSVTVDDAWQRPFMVLQLIREQVRPLLFRPDRWAEFYGPLGLYLFGALKFNNLSAEARRLTFWAAASAFHFAGLL